MLQMLEMVTLLSTMLINVSGISQNLSAAHENGK
jgi:hypothetical protein